MLLQFFSNRTFFSNGTKSSQAGFSILEVLVTSAIIGTITGVIVLRYGAFNNAVLLRSQAYEMALDLRETQVFSVSARGEAITFREEYGLYFSTATPNSYQLFRDSGTTVPAYYAQSEALGLPNTIDTRFEISKLCVNSCATEVDDLSITFKRPDFDAQMAANGVGAISSAEIHITSVADSTATRIVEVANTGQINVE